MDETVKSWKKSLTQYRKWWDDHIQHDGNWKHERTEAVISLAETIFEEMLRLRERLQFDPGGSDKIDELEDAVGFMRHNMKLLEQELDDFKTNIIRLHRDLLHRRESESPEDVLNWVAHETMHLSRQSYAKWSGMDEALLQDCAEEAATKFGNNSNNSIFSSATFSQAFCEHTGLKDPLDDSIVKGMLVGRKWVDYDGGSHWRLL